MVAIEKQVDISEERVRLLSAVQKIENIKDVLESG
jgi:hypothetical protein